MPALRIRNYIITTPLIDILRDAKKMIYNGRLKDIKPYGDYIMISCPEHSNGLEHNPDCGIYIGSNPEKYGRAHCFSCGYHGTFQETIAKSLGLNINDAEAWLISNYGKLVDDAVICDDEIQLHKFNKSMLNRDTSFLNNYQNYCPYLEKRKITRNVAEMFSVKYDPYKRQVIFPVFDEHDKLVTVTKRNIDYKKFELEKGCEKVVYGLNQIIKNNIKSALLVEGQFDCLTSWSFDFPAIASLGSISDEQIASINKSGLISIYLAMDNDAAGRRFTQLLKKKLSNKIILTEVHIPDGYKDINDLDKDTFWRILNEAKNS